MREKWYSLTVGDIEKKLNTNAASGLSPKAARSRGRRGGAPFFIVSRKSAFSLLGEILADLCLVLLIISSVIAICFDEWTTGITLSVIILINLAICFVLYMRSERFFESAAAFFRPSSTVIRGGKAYSVSYDRVVEGDVVVLSAGDILSFDARLVSSDALRVSVKYDREAEQECEKHAEGFVRENEKDIRSMCNMVHAGSRIISGGARAIVVATGRYTYYGALTGGVFVAEKNAMPKGLSLLKKFCSGFGLALTVAVLPFSFLCLLFSNEKVTLLTSFTSVLAIAASSMSQISCTACRIFFAHTARMALASSDAAALRSTDVMDRLMTLDYVFLLDGASSCDGILHFDSAICVDGEASMESISPHMSVLGEMASLYQSAEKSALTVGVRAPGRFCVGLSEFVEKCETDTEALKIRCSINGYVPGDSQSRTDKLFYIDRNVRFLLSVSRAEKIIDSCDRCFFGKGISPLTEDGKAKLMKDCENKRAEGKTPLVFTLSDMSGALLEGRSIFVGIVVLSQRTDAGLRRALARIESVGVRTVSFVRTSEKENEVISPVIGNVASLSDFKKSGIPLSYKFGSITTYKDFTPAEIDVLIKYAHSLGKQVAVIGFSDYYKQLSERADMLITCSALQYKLVSQAENRIETLEVPSEAESISARQDVKADADIIISRPSDNSGGLLSLARAFEAAGCAYHNLVGFFRYVLSTQFIRICMVLLPMLAGHAYIDARHALLCGFGIDIAVMLIFVHDRRGVDGAKEFKALSGEFSSPVRNNFGIILSGIVGALCAVILPNFLGSIDAFGRYLFQSEYLFVSMILLHLTVMFCVRKDSLVRRGRVYFNKLAINLSAAILLFAVFCFIIDPLGALFNIWDITLPYLLLTLVPSALSALLYFFIGNLKLGHDA